MKWFDKLTGKKETEPAKKSTEDFDILETDRRNALEAEKDEATRLGEQNRRPLDYLLEPIRNYFTQALREY